jgi:type II secretion system protein H
VRRAGRGVRGFTLIELVVVMVILGIAAAVVVPAFARLDEEPAGTRAAHRLAALVRSARSLALRRGERVSLVVAPAADRYFVRSEATGDSLAAGTIDLPRTVTVTAESAGGTRFEFDAAGRGSGGSLIVREGAAVRAIEVDPWTGEVASDER